jgi:5S rRNA maturation endonuclease (ribonuclease M5)
LVTGVAGGRREYPEFGEFVASLARDLNALSLQGWAVLVEGKRDAGALRALGYGGKLATLGDLSRERARAFGGLGRVVVMTDLDREGARLASRCVRELAGMGLKASLAERRRLKGASRGVFLHIENLGRFADPEPLGRAKSL